MNVLWLGQIGCDRAEAVGEKAACLSRLFTDFPVPSGFCLSTSAFDLWQAWNEDSRPDLPGVLVRAVCDAYEKLAELSGDPTPAVAVRSSGVCEDGARSSFAGLYETYLNVVGTEAVVSAVNSCWCSGHTDRVLAYCRHAGMTAEDLRMGVLVQRLVPADASAVAFSIDPIAGDPGRVVVNANWGLCESIVGRTVTPDTWVIRKSDMEVIERHVSDKKRMTVPETRGTREITVPRYLRRRQSVTDDEAVRDATAAYLCWKPCGGGDSMVTAC